MSITKKETTFTNRLSGDLGSKALFTKFHVRAFVTVRYISQYIVFKILNVRVFKIKTPTQLYYIKHKYTQLHTHDPTPSHYPPATMSTSTIQIAPLPIVNASAGARASSRGTRVKECVHCHAWCGNASKSCKSCKHPFPPKSTTGRKTRQGKSYKRCVKCGTEAGSNNQRACKNAACGHVFSSGAAAPVKTSVASKKRRHVAKTGARKKHKTNGKALKPIGQALDEVDQFLEMLQSFNSDPSPYVEKDIAQEQQALLDGAADSDKLPELPWDPVPEVSTSAAAPNPQCDDLEPFDSILNQTLTERADAEVEEWERQLMDELNADWLDQQTAALPVASPLVMASPPITV